MTHQKRHITSYYEKLPQTFPVIL